MNEYYPNIQPTAPQNNGMALTSIIAGLGGWLMAIIFICLSLILAFLGAITFGLGAILSVCLIPIQILVPIAWIVGIVTGHIALKQIKDGGDVEGGRNMAITGLISSYLGICIFCLLLIGFAVLIIAAGASIPLLEEILRELGHILSTTYA